MQKTALAKDLCGLVLADKPQGMSSTALVSHLRRELNTRKAGHTGILDRAASGLMLLLVGRATGFADFFLHADKDYVADFHFGKATDTHDREGSATAEMPREQMTDFLANEKTKVEAAIAAWTELKEQHPPIYSALKQNGRRLSDHVRSGKTVNPLPRPVRIYECRTLHYDPVNASVQVYLRVSGGTYVRSLARDLGVELGVPIHLGALRRTGVGPHKLDDTVWQPEKNAAVLLPPQECMPTWPRMLASTPGHAAKIMQGISLPIQLLKGEAPKRVYQNFFIEDNDGQALAWAVRTSGSYRYRRVLVDGNARR